MGLFQRYSLGDLYVPWSLLLVLLVMVITLIILVMEKGSFHNWVVTYILVRGFLTELTKYFHFYAKSG